MLCYHLDSLSTTGQILNKLVKPFFGRILRMMHTVASHTAENRMTASAVAACMAPLLLRPLLAGECEMEDDLDMNGDSSAQLIAAANAANSAQGIVTTLLEEYEGIFYVSLLDTIPENVALMILFWQY